MVILSRQGALARCVADGECLENLVCLQLCNGKPDESACQARQLGCRLGDTVSAVCNPLTPCGGDTISERSAAQPAFVLHLWSLWRWQARARG